MKTNFNTKLFGGILIILFCAAIELHAQGRGGAGGGGGGGRGGGGGGFGGGGFGGGGFGGGGGGGVAAAAAAGSSSYNVSGLVGGATFSGIRRRTTSWSRLTSRLMSKSNG